MRGLFTGWGIGTLLALGVWAILAAVGFWTAVGTSMSLVIGLGIGWGFSIAGMMVGSAFDD